MDNKLLESFIEEIYNSKLQENTSYSTTTLKVMDYYNINLEECVKFYNEPEYYSSNINHFTEDLASKLTEGAGTLSALITGALMGLNKIFGRRMPVITPSIIIGSIRAIASVRMSPVYEEARRQNNKKVCFRLMTKALSKVVASSIAVKLLVSIFTRGSALRLLDNILKKVGIDLTNIGNKSQEEIALDNSKLDKVA